MGVKRKISLKELNKIFKGYNFVKLKPTIDGISDTTYIVSNLKKKYILKIYEQASKEVVKEEILLLNFLKNLPTPKNLTKNFKYYENRLISLHSYLKGKSPTKINTKKVKEIGKFLAKFHTQTKKKSSSNKDIYKNVNFNISKEFKSRYKFIKNVKLKNHGIIHGDLFIDNAKFKNNRLSGVFDFIQACEGDFRFDLAVVANSWCFDKNHKLNKKLFKTLINSYDKNFNQKTLLKYMLYASLFYALQRYKSKIKCYKEYIYKFDYILNLFLPRSAWEGIDTF